MTKLWALLWLALFMATGGRGTPVLAAEHNHVLILGKVSTTPNRHYLMLKPIVDYAARQLRDLGIETGEVKLARDHWELARMIRLGEVDWVTDSLFPAVLWMTMADAEILLKRWKKGVAAYHSVFISRKDSPIDSIDDLVGKTLAFEDPGSTTAFFIPVIELLQRGYPLKHLASPREEPARNQINYVFARSEINLSMWVVKGLVQAGAYNNLDWMIKDHTPPVIKKELHIFHRTKPVPRMLELVRRDWKPELKQRLRQVLLHAHLDPAAKNALMSYQKTTRFETLGSQDQVVIEKTLSMVKKYHALWFSQ